VRGAKENPEFSFLRCAMVQRPKPEVREAILKAAGQVFAQGGFQRAALGDIVERAGTSIGNLYKYFADKNELFTAFISRRFTTELKVRIRAQVEALRSETNVFRLTDNHPYRRASEDLLSFAIAHRDRVVFLLLRAQGTEHERFARDVVRLLLGLALDHARTTYPNFAVTPASRRALTRIYQAFITTLGAILMEERTEHALREALALQATYHLSGLKALFVSTSHGKARS
jgi:AcrR family transcriptional regulator